MKVFCCDHFDFPLPRRHRFPHHKFVLLREAVAASAAATAKNFAAIDLGAESGRVVVGCFDGRQLILDEVHRFSNGAVRVAGHLHWDVLRIYTEVLRGLDSAVQQFGSLASVGVDTWGVDFGLLDRTGALIGNPYHYRDGRTEGVMERVFARVPREEVFAATGVQFMRLNTLYQLYATRLANPAALGYADQLLLMPDLINYWLTGEKASEYTIATTTQPPRTGS